MILIFDEMISIELGKWGRGIIQSVISGLYEEKGEEEGGGWGKRMVVVVVVRKSCGCMCFELDNMP